MSSAVGSIQTIRESSQDTADNSFLYEINIYDLRRRVWTSKTLQPTMHGLFSKGAYRSVAISSKNRVIDPPKGGELKASSAQSYVIDEDGEGGGEPYDCPN